MQWDNYLGAFKIGFGFSHVELEIVAVHSVRIISSHLNLGAEIVKAKDMDWEISRGVTADTTG